MHRARLRRTGTTDARVVVDPGCSVYDCPKKHFGLGYCRLHYGRFIQHGTAGVTSPRQLPFRQRVMSQVREGENYCWEWQGKRRNGYGILFDSRNQSMGMAHRVVYELFFGEKIDEGMQLDHICRNRGCVNPTHVRVVTNQLNAENLSVMGRTGRPRGVYFDRRAVKKPWMCRVMHKGKTYSGGYYATMDEAWQAIVKLRVSLMTHNDQDLILLEA
jgi:hypothetical protein